LNTRIYAVPCFPFADQKMNNKNIKGLVIYGSTRGNTQTVVSRLPDELKFPVDIVEASGILDTHSIEHYDFLLFFASTWGDGELQVDMENFFVRHRLDLKGKPYVICELGNYYGYDDFSFGALHIMHYFLKQSNGYELVEPFSMDSLPNKDWGSFTRWCGLINRGAESLP
jgi:flavodoxin